MNAISVALKGIIGILLGMLVIIVCIGVFYRYALNASLHWATEVPNFILVWMVFLGSVVAFHEKKHIAFDLALNYAPPHLKRFMGIIALLMVLCFIGILIYFGVKLVLATMDSPSEALRMPQAYLYICLPLSMTLMGISAIQQLISFLRGDEMEARS